MQEPLVSIGAINYNNSKYVIDTLNSIKAQSYSNIELVVIDDCSTDNSPALIEQWLKNYNAPFRFIKHEKNRGVCVACNSALNNASGKYVSIIATDDMMMPDKIKRQVEILESSADDVCGVYSDSYLIKEDSSHRFGMFIQRFGDYEDAPSGWIFEELLKRNFIGDFTMLVKHKCYKEIGNYDEALKFEDYDMLLRLSQKYKIIFSDYVSTKYRVRANSLTSTRQLWNPSRIRIYSKYVKDSAIAIKQIENIAMHAYSDNEKESLALLVPVKNYSKRISYIVIFWRLKLPALLGRVLLKILLG